MSKTAEERIAELELQIKQTNEDNRRLQSNYNQAYQAMEEARQSEAYLKGQVESYKSSSSEVSQDSYEPGEFSSSSSVEKMIEKMVSDRLEPRLQMVEKYATDALQQTAGREVDRALKAFKEKELWILSV